MDIAISSGQLEENIARVLANMARAAAAALRRPEEIELVAITKGVAPTLISTAAGLGLHTFGENYVQEARGKIPVLPPDLVWHFVGHLQQNKVNHALSIFNWIDTVDSIDLARRISARAGSRGKKVPVLIQVNVGREPGKSGVDAQGLIDLVKEICALPDLSCRGLMAIPPAGSGAEESRPYFRQMAAIYRQVEQENIPGWQGGVLSMGMSDDYQVAIEEGATMVRVGRAIFGERRSPTAERQ